MTTDSAVIDSPFGRLLIVSQDEAIVRIAWTEKCLHQPQSALLQACAAQLQEYFAGERTVFDLPLCPEGTPFQRAVWRALTDIPYGQTRSYGQIAAEIGRPGASRAVGQANHVNPILFVIPCHRVVCADENPGGYHGGIAVKEALLMLEKRCAAIPSEYQ